MPFLATFGGVCDLNSSSATEITSFNFAFYNPSINLQFGYFICACPMKLFNNLQKLQYINLNRVRPPLNCDITL